MLRHLRTLLDGRKADPLSVTLKIVPVPKPRMTRRDKWCQRDCVMRYRAFCDELRLKYRHILPASVCLEFGLPMPDSWTEERKDRQEGRPHQVSPDVDNLAKAVLDAMCERDEHIWSVTAIKRWSREGYVTITPINQD